MVPTESLSTRRSNHSDSTVDRCLSPIEEDALAIIAGRIATNFEFLNVETCVRIANRVLEVLEEDDLHIVRPHMLKEVHQERLKS